MIDVIFFPYSITSTSVLYVRPDTFLYICYLFNLEGYYGDETRICVCPKDGSEITNSFAVKVIDYLLDQAVDDKYRMFIKKERS